MKTKPTSYLSCLQIWKLVELTLAFSFENNSCRNSVIYAKIQKGIKKNQESPLPPSGLRQSGFHEERGRERTGLPLTPGDRGVGGMPGLQGDPDSPVKGTQTPQGATDPASAKPCRRNKGHSCLRPERVLRIKVCQTDSPRPLLPPLPPLPPLGETDPQTSNVCELATAFPTS